MIVSQIAATARNGIIGAEGDLPWDIPEDMRYFMRTTKNHIVVMGRKTYQSMGRPLPKRFNIVITRNPHFDPQWSRPPASSKEQESAQATELAIVGSLDEAMALCRSLVADWDEEIFIIGGGEIYKQALPISDRIYLTLIDVDVEGDTKFPDIDESRFQVRDIGGGDSPHRFRWLVYEKLP